MVDLEPSQWQDTHISLAKKSWLRTFPPRHPNNQRLEGQNIPFKALADKKHGKTLALPTLLLTKTTSSEKRQNHTLWALQRTFHI